MGDNSKIEWTDATWNPVTGCSVVSPGCTNCYAMRLAGTRLAHLPSRAGLTHDSKAGPVWTGEVRFNEEWLAQPLGWREPRMIFVCAHGDLFHEAVPDDVIDRVFAVMALAPRHVFQVLTKRSRRMRAYLDSPATKARVGEIVFVNLLRWSGLNPPLQAEDWRHNKDRPWPLPNVWLGVSVEDQARADKRIPDLLATPAALRFISAEPLLGPIDFERLGTLQSIEDNFPKAIKREQKGRPLSGAGSICGAQIDAIGSAGSSITFFQTPDHMGGFTAASPRQWPRLDWIIVGGESGPGARPMHPDWPRAIRDQCAAAGVPFFFKQWGEWAAGELITDVLVGDGRTSHRFGPSNTVAWAGKGQAGSYRLRRVGKARAGRCLDGRTHDDMPIAPAAPLRRPPR